MSVHHDLCFGCGQANLFGLQLEGDAAGDGLAGRFFVKQDHQGAPGAAHEGILATALAEAMGLALHAAAVHAACVRLEVHFAAPAPVGEFVELAARIERRGEGSIRLAASARAPGAGGAPLAEAVGDFGPLGNVETAPALG